MKDKIKNSILEVPYPLYTKNLMNNDTNYKAISYSNINYNKLISDKNQEIYNAIIDKKTKEQIKNKKEFTNHKFDGDLSLDITDKKPSLNSVKSPQNETNDSNDEGSI